MFVLHFNDNFYTYFLVAGLTDLESLNLDSCRIRDEGLVNLTGWR
jgi:hypothetical protein